MAKKNKGLILKPDVQFDGNQQFVKSHLDSVCEDAQKESLTNARHNMEMAVIQTKVLKGIDRPVPAEMQAYMKDTIQNALGQMSAMAETSNSSGMLNHYLDHWDLQKRHLGIEQLDRLTPGILAPEMRKRNAPLI